jgi:hypothetical protein
MPPLFSATAMLCYRYAAAVNPAAPGFHDGLCTAKSIE